MQRQQSARIQALVRCGLAIALMTVCAWVTVPFGPVPFTLQTFAIAFCLLTLQPKQALAAVCGYLVLGGLGLPVFSGMRGGIGMLLGPTGGFLWGFALASVLTVPLMHVARHLEKRYRTLSLFVQVVGLMIFILLTYSVGCLQIQGLTGMSLSEALLVTVVPFVGVDVLKLCVAVVISAAVRRALGVKYQAKPT